MRVRDAVIVAMQALGASKRQAPNVGGQSQFLTINEQFMSGVVGHDPKETERLIFRYEQAAERLLLRELSVSLHDSVCP